MRHHDYDVFVTIDGTRVHMKVDGFLALPLDTRIRAVLERRVEFFVRGGSVPASEALNAIRRAASAA